MPKAMDTSNDDVLPPDWDQWNPDDRQRLMAMVDAVSASGASTVPASPLELGRLVFRQAYQDGRHTRYLNDRLVELAAGRIDRLLVTMPPRHFKSECCSHLFPAWFLANNPDKRVILAGYGSQFAEEWGRKTRNTLDEFGHLWGVHVDQSSRAADRWDIEGHRGGMHTAGIGGPMTGRGADCLIVDDPVKDQAEAFSAVSRKRAYEWFQSVAYTRLAPGAKIVLIQTRWHMEDLAGKLLAAAANDQHADQWHVINFPAIAEEHDLLGRQPGEALFPERFNLEALNRIRANMVNDFWWYALYQQKPPAEVGRIIDCDLLRGYTMQGDIYRLWDELDGGTQTEAIAPQSCLRIMTVDTAQSSDDVVREGRGLPASWNVISTFDVTKDGRFIWREVDRGKWPFPELLAKAGTVYHREHPAWIGIEDRSNGRPLIQSLRLSGCNVKVLSDETKDKLTRAAEFLGRLKSRQIYIPRDKPWRRDLTAEFVGWTGHPDEQSDQIDTVAYACRTWQREHGSRVIRMDGVFAGPITGGSAVGFGNRYGAKAND